MFLVWGMGCWKRSALFIQSLSISSTSHFFFTAIVLTCFLAGETTPSTLLRLKISCRWWWAEDKNMITDVTDKLPVKDIFEMSCRPDKKGFLYFWISENSTFKGDKMNQILLLFSYVKSAFYWLSLYWECQPVMYALCFCSIVEQWNELHEPPSLLANSGSDEDVGKTNITSMLYVSDTTPDSGYFFF